MIKILIEYRNNADATEGVPPNPIQSKSVIPANPSKKAEMKAQNGKPKITLLIHDLRCGGAERVAAILASGLHERGYSVNIITLRPQEDPFYPLPPGVKILPLGVSEGSRTFGDRWNRLTGGGTKLKRTLNRIRPDILIGFMTESNILSVAATRWFGRIPCSIIGTEHIHPSMTSLSNIAQVGRYLTFPFLDVIVPVSDALADWYEKKFSGVKIRTIQNPVVIEKTEEDKEAKRLAKKISDERWILSMGRLHEQKGHDLLLNAFASLSQHEREGWHVGILGDGPEKESLQKQITDLGIEKNAHLLGVFKNPYSVLEAGDIFVLSSRYEGFAIALAEAMACGLPSVAFDCPAGPGDIVRGGVDGLLIPTGDVKKLSKGMKKLMRDEELRRKMTSRAPEVIQRFGREKFLDRWEELLHDLQ